jgi:hypothetical protein
MTGILATIFFDVPVRFGMHVLIRIYLFLIRNDVMSQERNKDYEEEAAHHNSALGTKE